MQVLNKFHLFKIFEIFTVLIWNINNIKSVKKNNKCFLIKKIPKSYYYFINKYFENKEQEQKRQMVSDKILWLTNHFFHLE